MKRTAAALLLALAACSTTDPRREALERVFGLEKDEAAFQALLLGAGGMLDLLKGSQEVAPARGLPVAAILYAEGEGDAVPLDLKARHYAAFRWPAEHAEENALVEPAVWDELERDLLLAGRHALPALARALAKESPDEKTALRAARIMMRIGGRPAMEAFAGLLSSERDLGGVRVLDVAAAALLVMGLQDLPLRRPEPDAVAKAAREWWAGAKERSEEDWVRESAAALAARRKDEDPEGVEPVLELLEGGKDAEPGALVARIAAGRGAAFDANRRLERSTGFSAWMPAWERVGELRASLRLWRAPEDLEARWRRLLSGGLLRLSVVMLGRRPKEGAGAVLWAREVHFHPTEYESVDLRIAGDGYAFNARTRELGTRVVLSEFARSGEKGYGRIEEVAVVRPAIRYSPVLRSAMVVSVEETDSRRPPRPPDAVKREIRARLKALAGEEGARALAYLQDPEDLPWLRERKAGAALLLMGDPAALELKPALEAWEIDMALEVAKDAAVREYLGKLKSAARP